MLLLGLIATDTSVLRWVQNLLDGGIYLLWRHGSSVMLSLVESSLLGLGLLGINVEKVCPVLRWVGCVLDWPQWAQCFICLCLVVKGTEGDAPQGERGVRHMVGLWAARGQPGCGGQQGHRLGHATVSRLPFPTPTARVCLLSSNGLRNSMQL